MYGLLDPTKSEWTAIEAPSGARFCGTEDDLVVWNEHATARIRAWAPDGLGVRTLLEQAPERTYLVRPVGQRIVGVAMDPSSEHDSPLTFWHMPRTGGTSADVTVLPPIGSGLSVSADVGMRAHGDFVAVATSVGFMVVNVASGKHWVIAAAEGFALQNWTLTLDDTWLYIGETLPGVGEVLRLARVRRIRLTHLDQWGTSL